MAVSRATRTGSTQQPNEFPSERPTRRADAALARHRPSDQPAQRGRARWAARAATPPPQLPFHFRLGHRFLKSLHSGVGDLRSLEIQGSQLGQVGQLCQARVGDGGCFEREIAERG